MDTEILQNGQLTNTRKRAHPNCFVCGGCENGMQLEFDALADGTVRGSFECQKIFEGYSGRLHGGVIASLLDSAMTNCLFARGVTAVTVELVTRYRHPVRIAVPVTITARLERSTHGLYYMKASISQDEKTVAVGTGKFIEQNDI